ncbi:SctQ family type III secretion system cytoplasmic ring protein BscQ [Bordetella bronchiseptica]|uniref:SctQ family type III secretion system cytoplasmic ring protein BscQ n=1 Tax=Bordetella bronchiseptica TaxID=518 RepID=UPI00028FBAA3|nr:SctQ family type III secretion system cytoplasmic ring protein BscQ [Bordetella bronchiseptica]AWQ07976.1 type III secretion system protein [Bordetella bronchiseptica]RSC01298.1 YscQ/HrcQ family type III secretion apparatus protein [Bordetella bronchiseptica]RSC09838.1 YscQ/HrcQ family type III secretion apparatus protein [Bordetella bronchiseptica]CCN04992.1 putative type III secretion protein [Bordetella bronchiseptica Bbr77]
MNRVAGGVAAQAAGMVDLAVPRLSAGEAHALSRIACHGARFDVRLGEPAVRWHCALTPCVHGDLADGEMESLQLQWAGTYIGLTVPRAAAAGWLAARLPRFSGVELPEPIAAAALEAMLEEVCRGMAGLDQQGPVRVARQGGTPPVQPHRWTLTVRAPDGGVWRAVLACDAWALQAVAAALDSVAPADGPVNPERVPVRLRADVGAASVTAGQLRTLRAGDVVLLAQYRVGDAGELWLSAGPSAIRVRAEHASFRVTQGWTPIMTEPATPDPGETPAQAEATLDTDQIPVRLTFDLGEREFTLAQLRSLHPGCTFDLERPIADGPVMVRANGLLLGSGRLVDIDGRIGVVLQSVRPGLA